MHQMERNIYNKQKKINKFIIGGKVIGYQMPIVRSIDVDDSEDLKLANILFNKCLK